MTGKKSSGFQNTYMFFVIFLPATFSASKKGQWIPVKRSSNIEREGDDNALGRPEEIEIIGKTSRNFELTYGRGLESGVVIPKGQSSHQKSAGGSTNIVSISGRGGFYGGARRGFSEGKDMYNSGRESFEINRGGTGGFGGQNGFKSVKVLCKRGRHRTTKTYGDGDNFGGGLNGGFYGGGIGKPNVRGYGGFNGRKDGHLDLGGYGGINIGGYELKRRFTV